MGLFRRITYSQAGDYYDSMTALEPRADELADQVEVIQYTPVGRIASAITAKRIFDVIVAAVAIVIFSPVMAALAVAIKLDSKGPVFFAQERIGLNRRRRSERRSSASEVAAHLRSDRRRTINPGRPFKIYKFRTMICDAECSGPVLACENDPRVTRVGRFMRKTRLDEIPQFLNVIRGDMSIIGPRPERSFFINQVEGDVPEFTMRLIVKPGITGLAQVENGYTKTIDEMKHKLFYDLKYIADISVMQEIKIIFKTVYVVLTGKGAC